MIRNFEHLIVFTSAPSVLPEQNDRYRIQPRKVIEILKSVQKLTALVDKVRPFSCPLKN